MSPSNKNANSKKIQRQAQLLALAMGGISSQASAIDTLDLNAAQISGGNAQWDSGSLAVEAEGGLLISSVATAINTSFLNSERLAIYDDSAVPGAAATEETMTVSLQTLLLSPIEGVEGGVSLPDTLGDDINIALSFNNPEGNDAGTHNFGIDVSGAFAGDVLSTTLPLQNLTDSYLNTDGLSLNITTTNGSSYSITGYSVSIGASHILITDPVNNDDDNDGIANSVEDRNTDTDNDPATNPSDSDGDTIPDYRDLDSDNDGDSDLDESGADTDNDGIPDAIDPNDASGLAGGGDSDNDGVDDATEGNVDTDLDGTPDYLDTDSDNDGILDMNEATGDEDGDGIPDRIDNVSNPPATPATTDSSSSTLSSSPWLLISALFVGFFRLFKSKK